MAVAGIVIVMHTKSIPRFQRCRGLVPEFMKHSFRTRLDTSTVNHHTTMSIPASSALPFELRVHSLESRIYGPQYAGESSSSSSAYSQRSIQSRIRDIEETLDRASQSSDALKRLLEGCKSLLILVHII